MLPKNSCFHGNGTVKRSNLGQKSGFFQISQNASLDFFDFLHDARHNKESSCSAYGMLPKILVSVETGSTWSRSKNRSFSPKRFIECLCENFLGF